MQSCGMSLLASLIATFPSLAQTPSRVQFPSQLIVIAVIVAVIAVALFLLKETLVRLLLGTARGSAQTQYSRVSSVLSPAELRFYHVLRSCVPASHVVLAKVRIADMLSPRVQGATRQVAFNRISSKHADFVLCDALSMAPMLVIELDDASHSGERRKARDSFVDTAYADAQLPILHVRARANYVAAELRDQIDRALAASSPIR
jgi:very-short-patch-repair endonuclease